LSESLKLAVTHNLAMRVDTAREIGARWRNAIFKFPNLESPRGSILRLLNGRLGLFGVT
jgi:hypothetical protein